MGYTTEFSGSIAVEPPLNAAEIEYLNKFADTRRMLCEQGPYFVDRSNAFGQGREGVLDYNRMPQGQPSLWCKWIPSEDGTQIEWSGAENFYCAPEWMTYLIEHFLQEGAFALGHVPCLQANHVLNGVIKAQGEDMDDRWKLIVVNNVVSTTNLE